ncbi:MAG: DUF4302 domain-containing protein, partial [Bacteroidales bacterium]
MKKITRYIFLVVIMQLLWLSCEKDKPILPEREESEDIATITKDYIDKLQSSTTGWILKYKPENYEDNIYLQLKFIGTTVNIITSYRGYHTEQTEVPYSFEGRYTPIIVFSEESIFGELSKLYNGSQKFKINYLEDKGAFSFIRSDGFDDSEFTLEKANTKNIGELNEAIQVILDQIAFEIEQERLSREVRLKFTEFSEISSDFYFYNLKTDEFSASIDELDTLTRTIALTYKETPLSSPTSVTVSYLYYPNGIILDPIITYNSVVVDSIVVGSLNGPTLELVKVGNAGAGSMGYMHTAPYPLTMTTDRSIGTADWLMSNVFYEGRPQLYTQNSDDYYSDLVNVHRATLGAYLEANGTDVKTSTRLTHQFYFYDVASTTPKNLQFSTHKESTTGNWFFPYRFTWDKVP